MSIRKLARIVSVTAVESIPDADNIEVAKIDGWRVVVGKGQFVAGDPGIYVEIDSFLPASDERFGFLRARSHKPIEKDGGILMDGYFLRTLKLRGVYSQGLLLPVRDFPELTGCSVGDDVSERLGVTNYDETYERLTGESALCDDSRGRFPSLFSKTEIERIQNLPEWFDLYRDVVFEATEKVDGQSTSMYWSPRIHEDSPFGICSKEIDLKPLPNCKVWQFADKLGMPEKFRSIGKEIAVQGEFAGPGIEKNRGKLPGLVFRVFRVRDLAEQRYLTAEERYDFCHRFEFEHVKVIGTGCFLRDYDMDGLLALADGKTDNGHAREGLVFKNVTDGEIGFKVVSNKYLLK